jgi:hypothetical protein
MQENPILYVFLGVYFRTNVQHSTLFRNHKFILSVFYNIKSILFSGSNKFWDVTNAPLIAHGNCAII